MEKITKLSLSTFLHCTMQWSPAFYYIEFSYCKVKCEISDYSVSKMSFSGNGVLETVVANSRGVILPLPDKCGKVL